MKVIVFENGVPVEHDTVICEDIDISPELWVGFGVKDGEAKDFSGKYMFPESNKKLH